MHRVPGQAGALDSRGEFTNSGEDGELPQIGLAVGLLFVSILRRLGRDQAMEGLEQRLGFLDTPAS